MLLTVSYESNLIQLNVTPSLSIHALKTLILNEHPNTVNVTPEDICIFSNQRQLLDTLDLQMSGIKDQDLLQIVKRTSCGPPGLRDIPPLLYQQPSLLLHHINSNPGLLNELIKTQPMMAEAVLSNNEMFFMQLLQSEEQKRRHAREEEQRRIQNLNSDPFNLQAQQQIEAKIREENITRNMNQAMELNPESFASVVMLYIPMNVHGVDIAAFIDSGAQMTCMSVACATRCNLMHLLDTRFAGTAVGVGTQKILGRIHSSTVKFGNIEFKCSFSILQDQGMDFLFGLDQLRHHQAIIDLNMNCLIIRQQKVSFMDEKDLPKRIKDNDNITETKNSLMNNQQDNNSNNQQNNNNEESKVQTLINLGFPRQQCEIALRQTNGDCDMAASLLFQQ